MLDNTQNPAAAGLRPMTGTERQERAAAMACVELTKKPGVADCSQSLWLSLFFDGTGNNRDVDTPRSKHSNVVRLFFAHEADNENTGRYPIYINGLGTPFSEIGEATESILGGAFGVGGEKRLQWAKAEFDKRIAKAKARATNPKQPIRMINVALFGFSRGSALARAFAVRLASECRQHGDGWQYQGYPIRLYFMGVFDTVASSGLPASVKVFDHSPVLQCAAALIPSPIYVGLLIAPKDGHYDWAEDLRIPAMVEQCIHYVAAHEVRDSFPLDSVRDGKHYPANTIEVVYPGVHSDVGGGYAPGEQARALQDSEKLSQVPLLHMFRAARAAGVPLCAKEMLEPKVRRYFDLSPRTASLFDSYQRKAQAAGPLETAVSAHLYQLDVARSHLAKLTDGEAAQARIPQARQVLTQLGNAHEASCLSQEVARINANGLAVDQATADAETRKLDGKTLSLREATLARAYEDDSTITGSDSDRQPFLEFFDYLVHDSVAGFGNDVSKLQNWRMMYFGDFAYQPVNDWSLADGSVPTEPDEAFA